MKNFKRTLGRIPLKLYLFLGAALLISFFYNDFGLVDIQKTAVILAVGVDRAEETFSVTAQIAVPKGNDRTTGGTSAVEIEGKGKTISDCIEQIYYKTGWVPKFVFCNLILLGESLVREDVFCALDFFLRNEYMPDSSLIAACEGSAKELLSSASAIDDAASLALEKLFSDAAKNAGTVMKTTLREFAVGYYGADESGYMPYVHALDQASGTDGSAQETAEGGKQNVAQTEKIYSAAQTALFSKGKMVALLSSEETFLYALLENNVSTGSFTAKQGEEARSFTVLREKGKVRLNIDGFPSVSLTLRVVLRTNDRASASPVGDITEGILSREELDKAERTLTDLFSSLWEKSVLGGCDLFRLNRTLYRSSPEKYREWNKTLLFALQPDFSVQAESVN